MQTFFLRIYFSLCLLGVSGISNAQLLDSISDCFQYKPKPVIKLDARNSFVTSSFAKVKGAKVGLSFHKTLKVGLGYSWMKSDYLTRFNENDVKLSLNYGSAFIEYTFFHTEHWHFEIPVQIGFGRAAYVDSLGVVLAQEWAPIYEPAMTFEYLFLKYFGAGIGIGYRMMFRRPEVIKEQFTSPIYIFKFRVFLGDIYKDVKREILN